MKTKNKNGWFITFIVIDSLMFISLFVFYGPFAFFRDIWISSSMTTATHKYLARTIYTENMINDSITKNTNVKVNGVTDASQITIGEVKEQETYNSVYEEQILKKDEDNDLYKVIKITGTGWVGHIIAIYDPTKITLIQSTKIKVGGQILNSLSKSFGAVASINASGFRREGSKLVPTGSVIMNSQVIYNSGSSDGNSTIVGFNEEGVLIMSTSSAENAIKKDGIVNGMEFRPFLIVNGVKTKFSGNGGWGKASRTAIGQRKDGIALFVVIDGRRAGHSIGISMKELADVMYNYGCYNASNLDGGGSSTMYVDGDIISVAGGSGYSGDRYLPNAWALIP